MNLVDDPPLRTAIVGVVTLLVSGEYQALANVAGDEHFTAAKIQEVIEEYGRQLVMPPGDFPPNIDLYLIEGEPPRRVAADVDLWTKEEGHSELTLQLILTEAAPGLWNAKIRDIHVL